MEFVKELLLSNNYWVLNKAVVSEFGVETAFILGVLAEAETMLADEDGWFFQTSETIEELTGLSNHKQTLCFKVLKEKGILEQKNKGVPMKRYFKINFDNIQKLLFKNFKNYNSKNLKTNIQNFSNNKESSYKESSYKESNNKKNTPAKVVDDLSELDKAMIDFEKMRKQIKKPMTDRAKTGILNKLVKLADTEAERIEILNQSIVNCWADVYPLKEEKKHNKYESNGNKAIAAFLEKYREE